MPGHMSSQLGSYIVNASSKGPVFIVLKVLNSPLDMVNSKNLVDLGLGLVFFPMGIA